MKLEIRKFHAFPRKSKAARIPLRHSFYVDFVMRFGGNTRNFSRITALDYLKTILNAFYPIGDRGKFPENEELLVPWPDELGGFSYTSIGKERGEFKFGEDRDLAPEQFDNDKIVDELVFFASVVISTFCEYYECDEAEIVDLISPSAFRGKIFEVLENPDISQSVALLEIQMESDSGWVLVPPNED